MKQSISAEEYNKRISDAKTEDEKKIIEDEVENAIGKLTGVVVYNAARGELVKARDKWQAKKLSAKSADKLLGAIENKNLKEIEQLMDYCTMFFTYYEESKKNENLKKLEKYLK